MGLAGAGPASCDTGPEEEGPRLTARGIVGGRSSALRHEFIDEATATANNSVPRDIRFPSRMLPHGSVVR